MSIGAPVSALRIGVVLALGWALGASPALAQSPAPGGQGAAPGGQDATYERLFGSGSGAGAPVAPPEVPSLMPVWLAPVLLMAAAAGGFWYMRQREIARPAGSLRVIQRQTLGDRSAVVLLEYAEPGGEVRRYLIGTGGGAPSLLVDLGLEEAGREARAEATAAGREARARIAAEEPEIPANRAAGWTRPEVYRPSDVRGEAEARADGKAEGRPDSILELRKQAAKPARGEGGNIADEILAERRSDPRDGKHDGKGDGKGDGRHDGKGDGRRDEFSRVLARIGEEEDR